MVAAGYEGADDIQCARSIVHPFTAEWGWDKSDRQMKDGKWKSCGGGSIYQKDTPTKIEERSVLM